MKKRGKSKVKKVTLKSVIGWVFSVLFMVVGIFGMIAVSEIFMAYVFFFLAGVVFFPPILNFVKERWNIELSFWLRFFMVVILLAIGTAFIPEVALSPF